ncbi:MAG: beta-N-acetylhexosaminidase [Oscillospiraceae bacterium]|nr:beta-N-acetylhexosaminidase [Oscillospiraceae bacterium]
MKRVISCLLALLLLGGAAGCAGNVAETEDAEKPQTSIQVTHRAQTSEEPEETSAQPVETQETEPTPEPTPAQSQAQTLLEGMTLREKVMQLFIVTPEQLTGGTEAVTQADEALKTGLEQSPVGGIIFFAQNLTDRAQITALLSDCQADSEIGLFLSVDEEGGAVSRLGANSATGVTSFPNMGSIGAAGEPSWAQEVGATLGGELLALGFNLDFAPVADVNSNPDNPVIGNRAFSDDPDTAAEMVAACVEGFREAGLLCTLKHFPSHGDTATDSHYGLAETEKTLDELEECELIPFQAGIDAGADLVMVGHISVPNVVGDETPASLSTDIVTGLLREEMGFDGLIVTDSLSMEAITGLYSPGEAAVLAVQAGADLLLMPEDLDAAVEGILDAVERGTVTEERLDESVLRILTVKEEQDIL